MDLALLKTLVAIADEGTLTAAFLETRFHPGGSPLQVKPVP